jgi:predicted amidohydrolase YtcJ
MTPGRLVLRVQMLAVIVGVVSCLWLDGVRAAEDGKADVVLRNGKIYTADPARSIRQSIAFTGNSIVAVGDEDEVATLIGPATKVVDLAGKLVLPGLIDTHVHPIDGAINGTKCCLAGVGGGKPPTLDALKPVIQKCIAEKPGGADDWLEAVQLYNYGFEATACDLDRIEALRPIALQGNDGHTVLVNSRGLYLLKKNMANPKHAIACAVSGAQPGLLVDGADLVEETIKEKIKATREELTKEHASLTAAVLKEMSANGITSLMDARVGPDEEDVWLRLYRTGRPDMRVRMAIVVDEPNDDSDGAVDELVKRSDKVNKVDHVDPNFHGVVKVFADNVMECQSQNAALLKPYLHDCDEKPTESRGELGFKPKSFAQLVTKLDAKGLAVHVHASGDRAVHETLDAFAVAREKNGNKDNRHSIAHLQLVDPADFPRFKALGVIANFQLLWAQRDQATEEALEPYLGPDRYRHLYPAGSLHAAGAMIVGGSDWDVTSYNPFRAFQTAVTRTGGKGQKPLNIDERIPLTTAVDAYTINAAFALKQDTTTGSLEVGKRADLVVLDRDIFSVDPDTIGDTKVLMTYLDGRLVYPANGTPSKRPPSCESD